MKKLQISLCVLMALALCTQSAQAMFSRDQIDKQALIVRDYVQTHPTEVKAFGAAAGILAATALYKYNSYANQPERGIKLPVGCESKYDPNTVLNEALVTEKLQNSNHKDCLTELPEVFGTTDYRDLIIDGARIYNQIKNSNSKIDTKIDTKDIVQLSWFLYSLNMYKDQDFKRGTTVIEDDGHIYQYLLQYVNQINPDAQKSWFRKISFNPYAYPRVSTHFPRSKTQQYGIDIRDELGNRQEILPGGQSHILFIKTPNGDTALKYESHGLYIWDGWLQHALNVIPLFGRKIPFFGTLIFGSKVEDRREHMTADIKKTAAQLDRNEKTISALNRACAKNERKYLRLAEMINEKYPFLKQEKTRSGNEAIITKQDLELSEYYNPEASHDVRLQELKPIVDGYRQTLQQKQRPQN